MKFINIKTKEIEVFLRELIQEVFAYKDRKINGTELGIAQVTCAVKIRKLFEKGRVICGTK